MKSDPFHIIIIIFFIITLTCFLSSVAIAVNGTSNNQEYIIEIKYDGVRASVLKKHAKTIYIKNIKGENPKQELIEMGKKNFRYKFSSKGQPDINDYYIDWNLNEPEDFGYDPCLVDQNEEKGKNGKKTWVFTYRFVKSDEKLWWLKLKVNYPDKNSKRIESIKFFTDLQCPDFNFPKDGKLIKPRNPNFYMFFHTPQIYKCAHMILKLTNPKNSKELNEHFNIEQFYSEDAPAIWFLGVSTDTIHPVFPDKQSNNAPSRHFLSERANKIQNDLKQSLYIEIWKQLE